MIAPCTPNYSRPPCWRDGGGGGARGGALPHAAGRRPASAPRRRSFNCGRVGGLYSVTALRESRRDGADLSLSVHLVRRACAGAFPAVWEVFCHSDLRMGPGLPAHEPTPCTQTPRPPFMTLRTKGFVGRGPQSRRESGKADAASTCESQCDRRLRSSCRSV